MEVVYLTSFRESGLDLPAAEHPALEHSERLAALIRADIDATGGRISFQRFMELALYAPGLGYYSGGSRKFGADGDFVTAPEISALFSHCVARQVEQIISQAGVRTILEVGAGSGVMAAQVLAELASRNATPDRYLILETSAELQARQRELLEGHGLNEKTQIEWLTDYPTQDFDGIVLANEVLDAMPVARFVGGRPLREQFVTLDGSRFSWAEGAPETPGLAHAVAAIEAKRGVAFDAGYVSEVGLLQRGWIVEMVQRCRTAVVLLFDYGYACREYYHPERDRGTVTCYYRHRQHDDVFHLPGLQDLTAHVDFSAIAQAAEDAGATTAGYTTQANFLLACGVLDLLEDLDPESHDYLALAGQLKQLMLPGEMGEIFKVMAISKNLDFSLLGFSARDFRTHL